MGLSKSECLNRVLDQLESVDGDNRRKKSVKISVGDALKAAYAIFALKYPSFFNLKQKENLNQARQAI